jgi:broad specificity phosphatase PhoE
LPDIAKCFPSLVKDEQLLPEAFEISRGEPLSAVHRRVSDALADLLDAHEGQSVVVVGHGVTLAAMWCAATGLDTARLNEALPSNIGGVLLTFSRGYLVDTQPIVIAELPV